jgi:hypothetical protein
MISFELFTSMKISQEKLMNMSLPLRTGQTVSAFYNPLKLQKDKWRRNFMIKGDGYVCKKSMQCLIKTINVSGVGALITGEDTFVDRHNIIQSEANQYCEGGVGSVQLNQCRKDFRPQASEGNPHFKKPPTDKYLYILISYIGSPIKLFT